MNLERITEITPAWDKRNPDPSKNYGIHCCELRMILKGPHGAVQFVLHTNWHLPHVTEENTKKLIEKPEEILISVLFTPRPADLGYHSPKPMYKGQRPMDKEKAGECPYIEGGTCYYDGSGLAADGIYRVLLEKGSEGVWCELLKYYRSTFELWGDKGEYEGQSNFGEMIQWLIGNIDE